MNTKCSVLLPVYNGELFLRQALDSVLSQEYIDFDIIIVDDCSTDSSQEIILEYKEKAGDKIKLLKNEVNLGVGLSLVKAFNTTNSTYIAQIGQDDIWSKDYLENQINYINNSKCNVVFSKVTYINEKGKKIADQAIFDHDKIESLEKNDFFVELLGGNFLCAPSSVFKIDDEMRLNLTQFWGYNNDRLQDYELWLNLSCYYNFSFNKNSICHYRIHQNNFSKSERRITQGRFEFYTAIRRVLFSEGFKNMLRSVSSGEEFLLKILTKIQFNIPYSKMLFLLIVEWCEYLLNVGFNFEILKKVLAEYYNRMGLLSKCICNNNGQLYNKINALIFSPNNRIAKFLLEKSVFFNSFTNPESIDGKSICIVEASLLKYALNNTIILDLYTNNRVIVISPKEDLENVTEQNPGVLILSDDEREEFIDRKIISFLEDRTNMFATGFFFDFESLNDDIRNQMYTTIKIKPEHKEIIRSVNIIDTTNPLKCGFMSEKQQIIDVTPNDKNSFLFNTIPDADSSIYMTVEEGIKLGSRIVANNKLYLFSNIEFEKTCLIPVFTPLNYYSSIIYDNVRRNQNAPSYELEYFNIVNSRLYRYMIKLKRFVHKYRLINIVNFVDAFIRRLSRDRR